MPDELNCIRAWKRNLLAGDAVSPVQADELEDHMLVLVAELRAAGLSLTEAMFVAERRIGPPQDVEDEHAKIHRSRVWQRRLLWMLTGHVVLSIFITIGQMFTGPMTWALVRHFNHDLLPFELYIILTTLGLLLTVWSIALTYRFGSPQRRYPRLEFSCLIASVFFGYAVFQSLWQQFGFNIIEGVALFAQGEMRQARIYSSFLNDLAWSIASVVVALVLVGFWAILAAAAWGGSRRRLSAT
ncbi:MAG: hypothetical protein AAF916_07200 [Planctomycetota bacterium]